MILGRRLRLLLSGLSMAALSLGAVGCSRTINLPPTHSVFFLNPSTGWIGGNGVILSTVDGGQSWHRYRLPGQDISALDFADVAHGWALSSSGGLWRTADGGHRWDELGVPHLLSLDFPTTMDGWAVGGNELLFHTVDAGTRWTQVDTPVPVSTVDFTSAATGWAVGNGTVMHTTDGGRTWTRQLSLPQNTSWQGYAWISMSSPSNGWALFALGRSEMFQEPFLLYRTVDGGQHWQPVLTSGGGFFPLLPGQPPKGAVFGPGAFPVAFSTDGNRAFIVFSAPARSYPWFLTVVTAGSHVSTHNLGTIWKTHQPYSINPGTPPLQFNLLGGTDAWLVVPQPSGLVIHSADGGQHWSVATTEHA